MKAKHSLNKDMRAGALLKMENTDMYQINFG